MAQVNEAERIVKLMLLIRENGPIDFAAIRAALPYEYGDEAGAFDATRRRFERDKKTLQESGVFFDINDRQQYSLNKALTSAAPLSLTKPQVSLLRLLCGALLQDESYPLKEELRMLLVKLGDELEIPDMLPQFEFGSTGESTNEKEPQGFAKVKKAIASRKRLSFAYEDSRGIKTERTVEPFGCFFLKSVCYVAAFDEEAGGERIFRLDRMSKIKVNGNNPKQPDFAERPFRASDYYGLPFQFGQEDDTARVFFDESVASRISGLTMNQGELELRDDGALWTVSCKDGEALAKWCIENGPGIHIIAPQGARESLIKGLEAYLADAEQGADHEG